MARLSEFRENPNNPSTATDEEIERLAWKLKRVPLGLMAMRIAYVTDAEGGGKMVISGNKRLRCLKAAYGENGEVPDDWFADVTAMSEAERHEFILDANISDGHWDLERLLAQYGQDELTDAMGEDAAAKLLEDFKADHETETESEEKYSSTIDPVHYEPTMPDPPPLSICYNLDECNRRISSAQSADIPEDLRAFLIAAAYRHAKFRYDYIAEYYAHASAEVQQLFEDSGLVVVDFQDAIKNGWVAMKTQLKAERDLAAGDAEDEE